MFDHERLEILERKVKALEQRQDTSDILGALRALSAQMEKIMADQNSILAKINANTSVLQSIQAAVTALSDGQASIADEIAALKAQIAAGTPPDFTALDAAADTQAGVIAGLNTAIPANTPAKT